MSENVYRLTLTERDVLVLLNALGWAMNEGIVVGDDKRYEEHVSLYRRLDYLEPVGTDGEGA